ncbi:ABC transporter substrate-binding protein [Bacillus sp. AFS094611]|uniref:ABC transporter substrate-binding protein n=3 Tax=Bacillaceae TaxID=186817 RepID=A0A2A7D9D4_BACAN|nr:ABC transporter substrate-binding protein [Bacillus thuringiensis serovar coreanensis]OTX49496.1 ABC transporter substrate-binding protein [Bacillus thuringiensis serovar sooncheon]OTX57325.1 ABC transporter substrate-binding protein [Bacillus thuringiensis serovar guiyangiensis]OTX71829.1 ABC transporter substrate-binding protein [Bacillus thuringiensis serovar roskildiensis]PDZ16554.1 ABC transporter substrate-binding protein [Bacillus anthracis]PDZ49638.1 ABC transporter substrate-bindin
MKKVYFNHDGGVDDLISLFLLLQMDNVKLAGVSVIPADCYLEPAMSASRKIIDRFSKEYIEVAASNSRAKNPFPKDWRMHAFYVDALPILNEAGKVITPVAAKPAHHHLIETLLQTEGKTTLLFTGPLTDLARALYEAPIVEDKIERLVWMGGTFLTAGNVHEPEHDGTAEWNSFWDPKAVARVWESKIEIDLVTLESTNQVPLTIDIRERWAKERKYIGLDFLGQCYAMVPPLVHFSTNSTYYLWDVLTTALVGNTNLAKTQTINSIVHTYGPSQGRTVEFYGGRPVNVVYDVNHNGFFNYITELAKKAST